MMILRCEKVGIKGVTEDGALTVRTEPGSPPPAMANTGGGYLQGRRAPSLPFQEQSSHCSGEPDLTRSLHSSEQQALS